MANSQDSELKSAFDLRDYVEATIEASGHASLLTKVVVVASVLFGVSWYNSFSGGRGNASASSRRTF